MTIRLETSADDDAISALTTAAFANAPHSSGTEAAIITRLRSDGDLTLSLLTEQSGEIIGHAAFSPIHITHIAQDGLASFPASPPAPSPTSPDTPYTSHWFGLGPISVHPDFQNQGVGSALIHHGLDHLRARGAQGCVVLGNPDYYTRFGFRAVPTLVYPGPPPEYFMVLALTNAPLPQGRVIYAPAFGP